MPARLLVGGWVQKTDPSTGLTGVTTAPQGCLRRLPSRQQVAAQQRDGVSIGSGSLPRGVGLKEQVTAQRPSPALGA